MAGKSEVANHVASEVDGLTKKQAGEAVDAVFDCITRFLKRGDRVQVPGFGTFSVSRQKARQGRNPKTGATITIAARNKAAFKPGKDLKEAIN